MEERQYIVVAENKNGLISAIESFDEKGAKAVSEEKRLPFIFDNREDAVILAYRMRDTNATVIRIK